MNPTTERPELRAAASLGAWEAPEPQERPRYAMQRTKAASLRQLPARLLLTRARTEGEAHRRARPVLED
ncbi:MAG: hypothetical protein KF878_18595 [Planctomycetes bacterium]|nr:hypothetical protein [Planctomycetota bacterium]MCW8142130.1 hypothetical protein [Planctomycetota bacterium]